MKFKFNGYLCLWLAILYFILITFLLCLSLFLHQSFFFIAPLISIIYLWFSMKVEVQIENAKNSIWLPLFRFITVGSYSSIYPIIMFLYWGAPYILKLSFLITVIFSVFSLGRVWECYEPSDSKELDRV